MGPLLSHLDMLSIHLLLQCKAGPQRAMHSVLFTPANIQFLITSARFTSSGVLGTLRMPLILKRRASLCAWVCFAGDWLCESCNAVNFANRTECFKCYEPR